MVRIEVLLGFLISCFSLNAQEWFPNGASWYYNQIILLQGETYSYFEVTGEAVIKGKNCKIITGQCNCTPGGIGAYLYEEDDKVFVFEAEGDSFKLLYDFNLLPGDTLIFHVDSSVGENGKFLIDSVTFFQTGTETLRVQHITHLAFDIGWGDKIIERIGSNGCMYPQVNFCDPGTGGLRCYEDEQTGLINFQIPLRPCSYVTAIYEPISSAIKIYPNPSVSSIHINSEIPFKNLTLFSSLGIPVYKSESISDDDFEIDVQSFPVGVYYLQIIFVNDQILNRPVLIQ